MNVLKRRQICPEDGCRRVLLLNEETIAARLGENSTLWTELKSLIQQFRTFECLIHGEDATPLSLAPELSNATACNHGPNICAKGIKQTLEEAISKGMLQIVRCPDPECKVEYAREDLRLLISLESFNE